MPEVHEVHEVQEAKFAEELKKMEYEPLLPIEKKLIGWSLGIGVVLLIVLVTIAKIVVPGT